MKLIMDAVEQLGYDECHQRIDQVLLLRQLNRILANSPFYREKYQGLGFVYHKLEDLENFGALPFTTKNELIQEQIIYPPFGRLTIEGTTQLRRVHITSGTTGRPFFVVMTDNDIKDTLVAGRRAFLCAGLRPDDMVIHCLNYCLWAGGVTDHLNLEATGATVIPFGVGNSKKLIQTIRELRPSAISCTPSYLSRLAILLNEDFGLSPHDLKLQKAFLGGEGGLQNPIFRAQIESQWNIRAIDANYGMADILSIFGAECEARQGLHFHGQGLLHLELIHPLTESPIDLRDGAIGEMVLTNLTREAQPVIRFRTRDIVKIISTHPCDCGRGSFRFVPMGRTDDMVVIRGINVFPSAVGTLLSEFPGWFSGEYEFILDTPPPFERPRLRIELARETPAFSREHLTVDLLERIKSELNFTPRIEYLEFGKFPRTDGKTKRIRRTYE